MKIMKIMFWIEVILTVLCVSLFIYDLIEHNYVIAVFMAFWGVVDAILAITYGMVVYGD